MKTYLLISAILLTGIQLYSQKAERLDTIFANEHKNVALFFPQPISQGITGASHFVFSHNRERQQYFGLLQAKPGTESNLLVIDAGGSVYSYILKYRKDLSRLNYFIQGTERIGTEKRDLPAPFKDIEPNQLDRETHYRNFCFYLLNKKERIGRVKKRNQGIILSVENIVFNQNELYFVIQIENQSSLDYDVNFLNLSVTTRQKGKKKSMQSLKKDPVFAYKAPTKIKKGHTARLVYVFPKFSLSNDRQVLLELNEGKGERDVVLKISHRFINNPN
ncbi:DUF4138 domain-containing protein [Christiangramia echinicola]|uniref:DUF4138 domain-containing protein n=1 Tax=Christiangramia echinicola TaxID=279359 RepID=UPI000416566E|nr:DUF4138 domain-containing protein [Christiangramia echinicola]